MAVVLACENTLGWTSKLMETMDLAKARRIEAGRLKKLMAREPKATLRNLELAIEVARRRSKIVSPTGLLKLIDEGVARAASATTPPSLLAQIDDAIRQEREAELPDAEMWIARLSRVQGQFRANALADWRAARAEGDPK